MTIPFLVKHIYGAIPLAPVYTYLLINYREIFDPKSIKKSSNEKIKENLVLLPEKLRTRVSSKNSQSGSGEIFTGAELLKQQLETEGLRGRNFSNSEELIRMPMRNSTADGLDELKLMLMGTLGVREKISDLSPMMVGSFENDGVMKKGSGNNSKTSSMSHSRSNSRPASRRNSKNPKAFEVLQDVNWVRLEKQE
jgi:hypothetical protein